MKHPVILLFLVAFLSSITACSCHEIGNNAFPDGVSQIAVHADGIQWKPCPPDLPEPCEMSVLEGHPKQADLFTVRFKVNNGFEMKPHTHPKHERVTILQGKVRVAFGLSASQEGAKVFSAGDYYVNSKDAVHSVWVDEPTILQITGVGPWEAHFVTKP